MPIGITGGHAWISGPAVAMVKGFDPGCDEAAAKHSESRSAEARETGSDCAFDAEHFLPADDYRFGADAAGDDRQVLHGLAADGADRHAADYGLVLVDHGVVDALGPRTVREDRQAGDLLDPGAD